MPIEIRELVIKVNITENTGQSNPTLEKQDLARLKKEIMTECLAKVQDVLRKKQER
jgi:hypothetical protein